VNDEPCLVCIVAGIACDVAFPMVAGFGAVPLGMEGERDLDLVRGAFFGAIGLLGFLFAVASLWRLPVVSGGPARWVTWGLLAAASVYLVSFGFIFWPALLAGLFAPGMLGRSQSRSRS
jgi:hypothetical protein